MISDQDQTLVMISDGISNFGQLPAEARERTTKTLQLVTFSIPCRIAAITKEGKRRGPGRRCSLLPGYNALSRKARRRQATACRIIASLCAIRPFQYKEESLIRCSVRKLTSVTIWTGPQFSGAARCHLLLASTVVSNLLAADQPSF